MIDKYEKALAKLRLQGFFAWAEVLVSEDRSLKHKWEGSRVEFEDPEVSNLWNAYGAGFVFAMVRSEEAAAIAADKEREAAS